MMMGQCGWVGPRLDQDDLDVLVVALYLNFDLTSGPPRDLKGSLGHFLPLPNVPTLNNPLFSDFH